MSDCHQSADTRFSDYAEPVQGPPEVQHTQIEYMPGKPLKQSVTTVKICL